MMKMIWVDHPTPEFVLVLVGLGVADADLATSWTGALRRICPILFLSMNE